MPITYKAAKEILSTYVGRGGVCADDPRVDLFTRQVLEYLLVSGSYGNVRKFCFCAVRGCFTIPYELETPLKIKIDGVVGNVWDRWFEFHSTDQLLGCIPADRSIFEDPNQYPTAYDLPPTGGRVGVLGTCTEDVGANVIVKGTDLTGREIVTVHNGNQIVGEYLSIRKGELVYTTAMFAKITAVLKSPTNGYVQLLWVRPDLNLKGFLSDYSPLETTPSYRRYQLTTPCPGENVKVSILGRIRLKEAYADNDYIPFDNVYTLQLAGQAVNSNFNNDPATAKAKDTMMLDMVNRENEIKRVNNGTPIEVWIPTSGGAIRNII